MTLLDYLVRRLAFVVPQLVGILLVSFLMLRLIPCDPAVLMLGPLATPDSIAKLLGELGRDRSLVEQFMRYPQHAASGDFGTS